MHGASTPLAPGVTISTLQTGKLRGREGEGQHPAKLGLQHLSFQKGTNQTVLWTARGLALTSVNTWTLQDSGRVNISGNDLV